MIHGAPQVARRRVGVSHRLLFAAAWCATGAAASPLHGQDAGTAPTAAPYGAVTVALSGVRLASAGRLEDYWDAGNGIRLDIHMPFHVGEAGITATTLRHEPLGPGQPGFRAIITGASWRFPLRRSRRIRPALSLEAGNYMTIFDGEQPKGLGKESEIYIGGGGAIDIALSRGTSLVLGAEARHVFTSTPVRLGALHAGLAYTFASPHWLRGVVE